MHKSAAVACVGLIGLFASLLYIPFLKNGIIFDDQNLFSNQSIYDFAAIPFNLNPRTFPYFTLAIVQVIWGNIEAHRLFSLGLHIACAAMVFSLVHALLSDFLVQDTADPDRNKKNKITFLALIGATWFVINPAGIYGAGYLIQRTILFSTLFSLLSLWYFRQAFFRNQLSSIGAAAFFYSLAVFSKEHAVLLPFAALPLATFYGYSDISKLVKRAGTYLLLCAPAAIWIVFARTDVIATRYEPDAAGLIHLIHGIPLLNSRLGQWFVSGVMQAGLFFDYFQYWLVPDVRFMSIDMRLDVDALWRAWWFFPKAGLYLVCPLISLYLIREKGVKAVFGYGLFYAWIIFITELVTIRFQEPFVLYRSYLWAPGYVLMLTSALYYLSTRKLLMLSIPIIVIFFFLARERLSSLESEGTVWQDAAAKLTSQTIVGSGRIFYNRSRFFMREKRYQEAISDLTKTISQNPSAYYAYYLRGTAYYFLSELTEAEADYDQSYKLNSTYGPAYFGKGLIFERMGCIEEAASAYKESLRLGVIVASLKLDNIFQKTKVKEGSGVSCRRQQLSNLKIRLQRLL